MALTLQQLRSTATGVEPLSLLPGQIAFNVVDKVIYVGDGTSFKTSFDGTTVPGVAGNGWYSMPMDFSLLNNYYVANPEFYGDVPTDQQVLSWSDALNHPIWTTGSGGGSQVYITTNAAVAVAPGATVSDKITTAIGVVSPDEGDVAIVTGLPDDVYEGLYFFTTVWVKGAAYAYPSASEVIYNNTGTTLGATVQLAISDLNTGLIATTATANTAFSTANSALSIASAALPRAGGTMTGAIVAQNIDVQTGYGVQFNAGAAGTINGINDSVNTTSSTVAASSTAIKTAYDIAAAALPRAGGTMSGAISAQGVNFQAGFGVNFIGPYLGDIQGVTDAVNVVSSVVSASATAVKTAYDIGAAALPRSGGTMTGVITFEASQVFPVSGIQDATAGQKGIVQIGTNINVLSGTISVNDSTTSQKGVVQLDDTLNSSSLTLALTARAGKDLQDQIDSLTLASNVTLAGSLNADTGLIDSVTTLGSAAGFVAGAALPAAAAGNADYYVLVTTGGLYSPPGGGGPYAAENGDWFLSTGTAWQYLGVGARPQSASYTTAGIVQLADTLVTYTGTSDTEAVTPNSLQDKLSDSTSLSDGKRIASSVAVKSAYDAAVAAQTTANNALPKAGGTMTGNITFQDAGEGVFFSGGSSIIAISDATGNTNSDIAASSTAVKNTYTLADSANTTANAALPKAGGTMTGNIVFSATQPFPSAYPDTLGAVYGSTTPSTGAGAYNVSIGYGAGGSLTSGQFNVQIGGASGDITSGSNNVAIGFDRNVANPAGDRQLAIGPDAYGYWLSGDSTLNIKPGAGLRDAADSLGTAGQVLSSTGSALQWVNNPPDGVLGVTGTAPITVDNTDPANPIIGASAASISAAGVVQLNNTVTSTSTTEAATANAVKIAYDAALLSGITSATTIYVNNTNGNDSTGERGTTKAFLTINAALAVALNDDTIFLSPGTFTENVTLTKGVTLIGTWQEQGIYDGTTILGNFVFDMVTPTAANSPSINHIRFISPNTSSAFKVLNNAQPEGITVISDCLFTQQGESSTTQFCFETVGTWTRSMYVRRATFDGNVKHAAGTASGATGGYLVLDDILGTGSATRHYNISTGTVEFRRPSNSISPVLQTGGVVQFTDCISGITPSDAITSPIFGGTNICYKGSAASVGTGTVYFSGWAPILGVINIGANMIYGWSALNVTPANLIISGSALAYTTAVPAAAAVVTASQQRPRFDLLTATSSVAAANQLATVLDSTTGTLYSVSNLDAGTY